MPSPAAYRSCPTSTSRARSSPTARVLSASSPSDTSSAATPLTRVTPYSGTVSAILHHTAPSSGSKDTPNAPMFLGLAGHKTNGGTSWRISSPATRPAPHPSTFLSSPSIGVSLTKLSPRPRLNPTTGTSSLPATHPCWPDYGLPSPMPLSWTTYRHATRPALHGERRHAGRGPLYSSRRRHGGSRNVALPHGVRRYVIYGTSGGTGRTRR